jgi:hypothetical protein
LTSVFKPLNAVAPSSDLPPVPGAIARWIAGGPPPAPGDWDAETPLALAAHGLDGLAAAADPAAAGAPPAVAEALRRRRAALVAAELQARPALDAAFAAFAAAGIDVLLVKGEALARTDYPAPGTRVRGDADAWPRPGSFERAAACLEALGWQPVAASDGEWLQPERTYVAPGRAARIDLHRRVLSQPLLAAALDFDGLLGRARRGDGIAMPAPADALHLAALHLLGHHADQPRGIWLHDLHRLAQAPTLAELAPRARATRTAALLAHALRLAQAMFGTAPDPAAMAELDAARDEPSAALAAPMSARARLWFDFRSLPDAAARARWLRELLLPDPRWLRAREGEGALPWLYLRRALRGWSRRG